MTLHITPSVAAAYVHGDKWISPARPLDLGGLRLKWYDVARRETPVESTVQALARQTLAQASATNVFDLSGDLGFVILHRCGSEFYFLSVNTWRNENEVWELVLAKENAKADAFALFPRKGAQVPTFCVWELGAVLHEQQAWRRYLYTSRDEAARQAYLADRYEGPV